MFFSAKIRWVGERQAGGGHAVRKKERERVRSGREFVQGESSSSERVCSGREFVQVESSFRERVRPVREFVQGESSFRERGKEKGGGRERERQRVGQLGHSFCCVDTQTIPLRPCLIPRTSCPH